jgi:hypothetical protein
MRAALVALGTAAALAVAGCGSSGGSAQQTAPATPTQTVAQTTSAQASAVDPSTKSTGAPTFRISLSADSHRPKAGAPWHFDVAAHTKQGGVAGTAKVYVFEGPQQVDGVGWFGFTGKLEQTYEWPEKLRGAKGVFLHVDVEGPGGTRRANWPVVVR